MDEYTPEQIYDKPRQCNVNVSQEVGVYIHWTIISTLL